MKNIIYLLLLTGILLSLGACEGSEYELENTIPTKCHKILYLKNSGKQQITLFNTGQINHYSFSIIKAGSNPDLEANVDISLLTQEEVDNHYSNLDGVNYKIISENGYSLNAPHLDFSTVDRSKKITVSLDAQKISEDMESDPSATWVLPLQISSKTDSVNANMKELFLQLEVRNASVGFKEVGTGVKEIEYGRIESSINYNATFKLDIANQWNLVCGFEAASQSYVDEYNTANKTSYKLLPEGSYSFAEILELPASISEAVLRITIDGNQLKELSKENRSGEYILPVRIKSVNMFEVSTTNNVYAVTIRITPKLDRSEWTITASSEELNGSNSGKGEGPAKYMLDGNSNTYWENQWKSEPAPVPTLPYTLIIDTKKEHTFFKFFMQQRRTNIGTKGGTFYISPDNNNWTKVGTFQMAQITAVQEFDITEAKGRYIKIVVESSHIGQQAQLAEFYAYGE